MNNFLIDHQDDRLQNIQRDDFDCFTFDTLSISELKRILKGKSVLLNRFLMNEDDIELINKEKTILSKVRLIDNIVKNDPYTKAFLVFQTVSWKLIKEKTPFILIPVRIFNEGRKIVRDGDAFVNPMIEQQIGPFEDLVSDKDIFGLDNSVLTEMIHDNNGRLIYEMYLTHFKISYESQKQKVSKRFVTVDSPINYMEQNNDLIPMDFELINIKKAVLAGNNTLLDAKQGTKKVALLVNIISEFVARNKSVLYVSEKNYRSLRDAIKAVGLSDYIDDVLDTEYENKFEKTEESKIPFKQLEDIVEMLHDYQENLLSEHKGYALADAFSELILLRDLPQKEGVVEFFDELVEDDLISIIETLQKLQSIIDEEQYIVPADLFWNDLDVRNVKYKEADVVKGIQKVKNLLQEIQFIIKSVRLDYGIMLPTTYDDLRKHLGNLDYMNTLQYPSSWFEGDAFSLAKENINSANSVAGRTLSLDTTLSMTYKPRIKNIEPNEIVRSLYGDYFDESHHKVMNKLIISKHYSKGEIEKLETEIEKLLFYKEQFENMWGIQFEGDFATYIISLTKLIDNKLFRVEWANKSLEEKRDILDYLRRNQEMIYRYLKVRTEVRGHFEDEIIDLEESFIDTYIESLSKNLKKTPEILSVYKVVDQFSNSKFQSLRKIKKIQILRNVKEYKKETPKVDNIRNEISKLLSHNIELENYKSYIKIFEQVEGFDNPYLLNFKIDRKRNAELLREFKKSYTSYKYLMKDSLFNGIKDLSIEEIEIEIELFKKQAYRLMEVEEEVVKFFKKQPEYLTVQEIRTIMRMVENYQINSKTLKENSKNYSLWYGDSYSGMTTAFKGLRIMLRNFDKFMSIFKNEESAVAYFKKREYKKVNEMLYSLRVKLNTLEDLVEEINRFFVQPVVVNELHLLDSYLSQFSSQRHMVQWVEFVDGLQSLRNFSQLQMAASINNGLLKSNIVLQFKYAYCERIVSTYYKGFHSAEIVGRMKTFNQQNSLVHKQRILDIRYRRRKKVVLTSLSGIDSNRQQYDLIIVDGAERIHSSYMHKLFSMGKTTFVLFDQRSINIDDSIYNYINHQPMYKIENNYHISPYLSHEGEHGVLFHQNIEVTNRMPVIDKVVSVLLESDKRVNVVCSTNQERVEIYNLINSRISKQLEGRDEILARLYVLLYYEYLPTTDVTYLLLNEMDGKRAMNAIQTTIKNSRELIILDEGNYLKRTRLFTSLDKPLMELFETELDPISKHIVSELGVSDKARKMISPYDFVVGEGNDIFCLVKITFNNERGSDILEETQMLFDSEYDRYQKFIIGIDDLYFRHDEIINQLKEVIKRGSSE